MRQSMKSHIANTQLTIAVVVQLTIKLHYKLRYSVAMKISWHDHEINLLKYNPQGF